MTRSTARPSWFSIWLTESSGSEVSPRRSSAISLWELRMARSPPLTATYMGLNLHLDAARQADDLAAGRENHIDAHRVEPVIVVPVLPERLGKPGDRAGLGVLDAGAGPARLPAAGERRNLEHQRAGCVGIL